MPLYYRMDPDTDVNVLVQKLNDGIVKLVTISENCRCVVLKYPQDDISVDTISAYIKYLKEFLDKPVIAMPNDIEFDEYDKESLIRLREHINEILEE